jgi:hypothetical protein
MPLRKLRCPVCLDNVPFLVPSPVPSKHSGYMCKECAMFLKIANSPMKEPDTTLKEWQGDPL